jgi:hypothetical protein
VSASQEFLVNRLVTAPAVAGRQFGSDNEAMVILLLLTVGGLVAVEAIDASLRVRADFVLMNH